MFFVAILGGIAVWLLLHVQFVLTPQIHEIVRKLNRSEFHETAHQKVVQLALDRLMRQLRRMQRLAIFLIFISICLLPLTLRSK